MPESPFRHLNWFTAEHAEVFFGRGYQVRELYDRVTDPGGSPVVLLFGQSGVGKSSLLNAGVVPRLAAYHEVRYVRRNQELGLLKTLMAALRPGDPALAIEKAWPAEEERLKKPVVLILDQVEEAFTRPNGDGPDEIATFITALQRAMADRATRPRGRLVMAFRKEWLAEIHQRLKDARVPRVEVFLRAAGSARGRRGDPRSGQVRRLQRQYRLQVEDGLAEIIADDLLSDRGSPVAPALQVLLTKMWERAKERSGGSEGPHFDRAFYESLRREGLLLGDFLNQQLGVLRTRRPDAVDSGLALDLLAFHTTSQGTAGLLRTAEEVSQAYCHAKEEVLLLLQQFKDLYLLAEPPEDRKSATRLMHDTLAPLVRHLHDSSDRPGQRARRLLDNRAVEWDKGRVGNPLDESDLSLVEAGEKGTRAWTDTEGRLVRASRDARNKRKLTQIIGFTAYALAALAVIGLAIILLHQSRIAQEKDMNANHANVDTLASIGIASTNEGGQNKAMHAFARAVKEDKYEYLQKQNRMQLGILASRSPELSCTLKESSPVASVCYSGSTGKILTASGSVATVWDPKDGSKIATLNPQSEQASLYRAIFSPDGKQVITASSDWTSRVWDAVTGKQLTDIKNYNYIQKGRILDVTFSPDGATYLTASNHGTVMAWQAEQRRQVVWVIGHVQPVTLVAYSQDGKRILSGSEDGRVIVWDAGIVRSLSEQVLSKPNELAVFSLKRNEIGVFLIDGQQFRWSSPLKKGWVFVLDDESGPVRSAAFDPGGKRVVVATRNKGPENWRVKLWDVESEKVIHELSGHTRPVNQVAFSPDGRWIATASEDATTRVYDANSGLPVRVLQGHSEAVRSIVFSPDGKRILTGSNDGTARLYSVETGTTLAEMAGQSRLSSAIFNHDGTQVATASDDGTTRLWDFDFQAPEDGVSPSGPLRFVASNPRGTLVAVNPGGKAVHVYNIPERQYVSELKGDGQSPGCVSFVGDGNKLVSGSDDGAVRLFDSNNGKLVRELGRHERRVRSVAASGDGRLVVTTSEDGTARVWEHETGKASPVLWATKRSRTGTLSTNKAGTELSTSDQNRAQLVGVRHEPAFLYHESMVLYAAFNRDGDRIVTVDYNGNAKIWNYDENGKFWNAADRKPLLELSPHPNVPASYATFDPDGRRIYTGYDDGVVLVWDGTTGSLLATLAGQAGHRNQITSIAFSPDGQRVATASEDATVRVWDPTRPTDPAVLSGHLGPIYSVAFSPDGKQVGTVSADRTVRTWKASGGELTKENWDPDAKSFEASPAWIKFDRAKRSADSKEVIEKTGDGLEHYFREEVSSFSLASFPSKASDRLLTMTKQGKVQIYDIGPGLGVEAVKTCWQQSGVSAAIRPDGKRVVLGTDRSVFVWDHDSNVLTKVDEPDVPVTFVTYSPDGQKILAVSDRTAELWTSDDSKKFDFVGELRGHTGPIRSALFSPDGHRIFTASDDGTVRGWDSAKTQQRFVLIEHTGPTTIAGVDESGTQLITSSTSDDYFMVWNPKPIQGDPATLPAWVEARTGTKLVGSLLRGLDPRELQPGEKVSVILPQISRRVLGPK